MAFILKNTLRKAVFVKAGDKTVVIQARGRAVVDVLPTVIPAGVLYGAASIDEPKPVEVVEAPVEAVEEPVALPKAQLEKADPRLLKPKKAKKDEPTSDEAVFAAEKAQE